MARATEATQERRFTLAEYHRMAEAGIFEPGERVELIRGVVRRMSPKNDPHVVAAAKVIERLILGLQGRASVYSEAPLRLAQLRSEPEPDILVTSSPVREDFGKSLPRLVVEVAESSLHYDMSTKADLYASAGIPEYWVVNLAERELVVFRTPRDDVYVDRAIFRPGDLVALTTWPDVSFDVSDLLPGNV